jgi:type VI secretion system ImpA family protein
MNDHADLIKPISISSPVGEDIFYDEDFIAIKEKRVVVEERSIGLWKEKKSSDPEKEKSITEICLNILKNKSKNLQVVAYLFEDMVKNGGLNALEEGFEILTKFCENYWETCYPLFEESVFSQERIKIFVWMDEKIANALRFSLYLISDLNINFSFNDIELVNKIGVYAKKNSVELSSDIQSKYPSFIKKVKENLIKDKILQIIQNSLNKINHLENILKLKIDFQNNFFSQVRNLINDMENFFKSSLVSSNNSNLLSNVDNFPLNNDDSAILKQEMMISNIDDRNRIYEQIELLNKKLLALDPHSPVPHFIFKLLTWKDKSFLDIIPELGVNAPLLDFLKFQDD